MNTTTEFKKRREFGEIINDTFQFIKQNFRPLMKVLLYFCGFFILGGIIATAIQSMTSIKALTDVRNDPYAQINQYLSFSYAMVLIFSLLNYTALNVSILSFISLYVEKGKVVPEIEEVWSYFRYYFMRVLGSSIVVSLFLSVCFLCCGIPGIYVFPAMVLFFPVMIFENGTFAYSFGRAFRLLKDQWWITSGTIFMIWFITYASMSIISLPAIGLTMAVSFLPAAKEFTAAGLIISSIIQHFAQLLLIIPIIGISLCYFNLSERVDNTGLMDRINQLGETKKAFEGDEQY
ncbi:hypothetical protein ACSBL2_02175 [Pedobacter sp. AW31-3R]|uniref:hypothetical protein n=1 Tax=Pedobacter sp. AW31-3R TaxID=3445781 RepID=UPI003FA07126